MAVPVAGQIIRASDVITFEDAKPRVHAYDSVGNVVLNAGTIKLVVLDAEMYDSTGTMHTGGNPSRLVAPIDGIYRFSGVVTMPTATYTTGLLNLRQDAAGASGGGTSLQNKFFVIAAAQTQPQPTVEVVKALTAGQYFEMFISQVSGADRTTMLGPYLTRAYMEYIASS